MASRFPRSVWLLLIGVLAFAAAGCGGGSDRLSEDDFLEQFDDACNNANADVNDLDAPESGNFDQEKDLFEEAKGIIDDALADFQDITPPEDLQDEYDDAISALEDGQDALDDLIQDAEDEDQDAIEEDAATYSGTVDDFRSAVDDLGSDCDVLDDASSDVSTDTSTDFSTDTSTDFSTDSSTDFSTDASTDFSTDFSTDVSGVDPASFIPEYGSDPTLDSLADACYSGDFQSCDDLYSQSPSGSNYESYGDTCAGRQAEGTGQFCTEVFGGG